MTKTNKTIFGVNLFILQTLGLITTSALALIGTTYLSSNPVSAYSATITTGSDIVLNISPAGDGTAIHTESINVSSTCRAGYNLSIATPTGSNLS